MRHHGCPLIEGCFIVFVFDEWCKEINLLMSKKYTVNAKINNNPDGSAYCVKYRVNDLIRFTNFLDNKWPDWKWFNVYSDSGINKWVQLTNFTKNKRPLRKFF